MISPSADDTDLDPVFGVPLLIRKVSIAPILQDSERETYPSETVEDIDVFPGVQIIDSALTVDLKSVCSNGLSSFRDSLVWIEEITYVRPF